MISLHETLLASKASVRNGSETILSLRTLCGRGEGRAPQRYGWRAAEPDMEEVRAEILRKVEAMERKGRACMAATGGKRALAMLIRAEGQATIAE
jgi:hypothetical protein